MDTKKETFSAVIIALFACYALYWGYKYYFPTKYVYVDSKNIFHNTPVCDSIEGMQVLEEINEVTGSLKVDEKDVFYDEKYIMCDYCFSPMEIESRIRYINRSLK